MSTAWVIPSKPDMYDSDAAFRELTEITWSETGPGIQTGDTVYIYLSSPISAIGTRCQVIATGLPSDDSIDDRRFWRDADELTRRQQRRSWMVLRRSVIFEDSIREQLSFQNLQAHGLQGSMAGRQRLPATVLNYVTQVERDQPGNDAVAEASPVDTALVEQFAGRVQSSDFTVEDRYATSKTRGSAQRVFADAVKTNYDYRCAITGISTPAFLVASHIVPWADDETTRLDPSNGICLSTLVDRAFDTGILTIDEDCVIHIALDDIRDTALTTALAPYEGRRLSRPVHAEPNPEYLRRRLAANFPKWQRGGSDSHTVTVHEMQCLDCFFVVSVGSICDTTGLCHERT